MFTPGPLLPTALQTQLLVWSLVIHVVADWMLQTEWMATNKRSLRSPAAWVHSGSHFVLLLLIFPVIPALFASVLHLLIDTRVPLRWWMIHIKRIEPASPVMNSLQIWMDQMMHICVLAVTVLIFFQS